MTNPFDDALLDRARRLGAATVHEAAGRRGALPPTITPVDPSWRIAGPACTVRSPAGDNLTLHRAIVAADPARSSSSPPATPNPSGGTGARS